MVAESRCLEHPSATTGGTNSAFFSLEESALLALSTTFGLSAFEGGGVEMWVLGGRFAGQEVFDGENLEARDSWLIIL